MSQWSLLRQDTLVRALQPVGIAVCMCASASPLASRAKAPLDWQSHQTASWLSEPGAAIDATPNLAGFRRQVHSSADKQDCLPRTESLHDDRNLSGKRTMPASRHNCRPSTKSKFDAVRAAGPIGSGDAN